MYQLRNKKYSRLTHIEGKTQAIDIRSINLTQFRSYFFESDNFPITFGLEIEA